MIITDEIIDFLDEIVDAVGGNFLSAIENSDDPEEVIEYWRQLKSLKVVSIEIQAYIINKQKVRDHE